MNNKHLKTIDIPNAKWDYLVILDACRFDYFEKCYQQYLPKGTLERIYSPGSCTNQWRDITFPDMYDYITYISANPQINRKQAVYGYTAGEHFSHIYELWQSGWLEDKGTVAPDFVTDETLKCIGDIQTPKTIIHYMQPHAPYFCLQESSVGYTKGNVHNGPSDIVSENVDTSSTRFKLKMICYNNLLKCFKHNHLLGNHPDWQLRKWLNLPVKAPMEGVLRYHDVETLRMAYQDNLEMVLKETARLISYLKGTIIVTSDHGELLGEDNSFSHPIDSAHPILREVPWYTITQTDAKAIPRMQSEEKPQSNEKEMVLKDRLQSLGYM